MKNNLHSPTDGEAESSKTTGGNKMATKDEEKIIALGANAAYNLADINKTRPQFAALTPKYLTKVLEFK